MLLEWATIRVLLPNSRNQTTWIFNRQKEQLCFY